MTHKTAMKHDAARAALQAAQSFGHDAVWLQTRDLAALLADRDALAERLRAFEHEVMTGRSEQHERLVDERDALARRLAEAEALLRMSRDMWVEDCSGTAERIDAFLAERKPGAARPCRCSDVCEWSHEPFPPGIYCRREPRAACDCPVAGGMYGNHADWCATKREPGAAQSSWTHGCMVAGMNLELWRDDCPNCGRPRSAA